MKTAFAIGIIGFLPSMAFGSGFNQLTDPNLNKIFTPASRSEDCADFSGNWKGACTEKYNDEPAEVRSDDVVIKQYGCQSIQLGEHAVPFGGSYSVNTVSSDFIMTFTLMLDWNKDKTSFVGDGTTTARGLGKVSPVKVSGKMSRTFKLVDGKLVATTKSQIITNSEQTVSQATFNTSSECTYEKQ